MSAEDRSIDGLIAQWKQDPEFRREYDALSVEFDLSRQFIQARVSAGLTQAQLAKRMKTSQAYIARLESGREMPSTRTLKRFAEATEHHLHIQFHPRSAVQAR